VTGHVRIIAGRWRRRRLPVPPVPGLRPPDPRTRAVRDRMVSR